MTKEGSEQLLSVSDAKGCQPKCCMANSTRAELIHFKHWPVCKQKHQPRALQPIHQEPQRLKRHGIGPVQILDNNQEGRSGQTPFEDRADRKKNLPPELFRLDMLQDRVGVAETKNMEIERHQARDLFGRQAKLR